MVIIVGRCLVKPIFVKSWLNRIYAWRSREGLAHEVLTEPDTWTSASWYITIVGYFTTIFVMLTLFILETN
jgi:hypothetical protein